MNSNISNILIILASLSSFACNDNSKPTNITNTFTQKVETNSYVNDLRKLIKTDFKILSSDENIFLGKLNFNPLNNRLIGDTFVYKKYVIFEPLIDFNYSGFKIFLNRESINYVDYKNSKPIYTSDDGPFYFYGIYGYFLFIDSGTATGYRGLTIINLENDKTIYQGYWNGTKIVVENSKVYTYKYFNETEPNDEHGATYKYFLHKYLFDLNTEQEIDLKTKEIVIGN